MKKVLLLIMAFVLSITFVQAKENKLYFKETGNRLYYESKLTDEDFFMKHVEMTPGDSFTDELTIENKTKEEFTLYFKIAPRQQSVEADELLDNINMKIKLDGDTIYEGKAKGLDYKDQGVNLQDAILIGKMTPSKESKMVVETELSEYYDNTDYNDFSYIDWKFYVQFDNEDAKEIIEVPNTFKNQSPYIVIISIIMIALGVGIVTSAMKKKK